MMKFSTWLAAFAIAVVVIAAMGGEITGLDKIIATIFICASFICASIERIGK